MRVRAKPIRASKASLRLRLACSLCVLPVLWSPGFAHAINCDDTLGPGGSAVLSGDLACAVSPALTIVGPFTFDLADFTISCALAADGSLSGTGIELTGSRAKVRDGTIADCDKGVLVSGDGRHELKRLTVTSPGVAGDQGIAVQVKSDRNRFIENTIREYAGEGFRLGDDGVPANRNLLTHNEATGNANHGFRVRIGERNLLLLNRADDNAAEGFRSQDSRNRFIANTANGNGDEGFRLRDSAAQNNLLIGNIAEDNGLVPCNLSPPNPDVNPGIAITNDAANNRIINNITEGNCIGIAVATGSLNNQIINNIALDNDLVDLADGNVDCANNRWRGNLFASSAAGPAFSDLLPACIR